MNLTNIVLEYFKAFERKELDTLSSMFHEDICLKDWNIDVTGKDNVINANAVIFNAIEKITVNVKKIYLSERTVIAELEILADTEPPLPVVDIITYHPEGLDSFPKIESITAYRGS